jgi:NADPH:quinone reductase-like Zn-dependent oxidoreductase
MRAAVVSELGKPPAVAEVDEPAAGGGEAVVEILAAPVNPIDLAVAAGRNPAGHPPLPFVPGCEGVGTADGRLVWVYRGGVGIARNGCFAERVAAPDEAITPVPEGADPALAAAMGIAGMAGWASLSTRVPVREDDVVLVLGATGTVGTVAVQAARLLGARRVVAAGRDSAALGRLEADATVALDGEDLVAAFRDACDGGPTLVFDPLWGEPAAAAIEAAARGARVVQLGQSAGATSPVTSAAIRFKGLEIYGFSNFNLPKDVLDREYARLVEHAMNGDIRVEIERLPLDAVGEAWERQAGSPHSKLVLAP